VSLIDRKPLSIGRTERERRDDRVFVVAAEDTYAPKQYFEYLPLARVKVIVLPTPVDTGLSSPSHVVDRLKDAFETVKKRGQVQSGDEFWVCLDTDHHMTDTHLKGTLEALRQAKQVGFELAISNPCFDLWLLLHYTDVARGTRFAKSADVVEEIRKLVPGFHKTAIKKGMFTLDMVPDAIQRARALEEDPDNPAGPWPEDTGTRVYLLVERVLDGKQA